ncbi:hypothetical protein GR925_08535 [Streptomyces sp. HUCO-GS316]|uniref:hypothetical protein n=1 Tax=Streptomyces sp. HUCO-GS316 TaxID=2692198 RepID=UPI00137141AF|nr:hypothetical protein [Streptomyces sp. HUCO-GS316]MXM63493.1 hypothetical protein [Streptomyces sp. HUCO-GS316]
MPERDPVREPEKVNVFWFGQEMNDQAKAGLRELRGRFPNSQMYLWVQPRRRPGEAGRQEAARLMEGYRTEAVPHGYEVRHVGRHARELARAVEPKYNEQTIRDLLSLEMGNQGAIAAKDFVGFAVQATNPGAAVDLSVHHMRPEEWEAVRNHQNFSDDVVAPVDFSTAELKIVDLSHGEDAISRNLLHAGYQRTTDQHSDAGIEPQTMPHFDVFTSYVREGTRGPKAMAAAAQQMLSYYSQMARDEVKNGNVTFNPKDGDKRFRPETINLAGNNMLGAKFNPQDPDREDIIGRMAVSALADGVYLHFGTPRTPPGEPTAMPRMEMDPQVMREITMQAFQVGDVRVLPQMSLGKDFGNSWRTESTQDPGAVTRLTFEDHKVTLVQASNFGVREAVDRGWTEGLAKPGHIPYEVKYSTSADNSPRRTPSPNGEMSAEQLRQGVAGLTLPRSPSPEGSDPTSAAGRQTTVPRPPMGRRTASAPPGI